MTKNKASKIAAVLLFAALSVRAQRFNIETQAASTSRIADTNIAERIQDLGRGYERRMAALKWIESAGKPAIPDLLEAMKGNNEVAAYSCYALGVVGTNDQRVMHAFITALQGHSNQSVRGEVLFALRKWGPDAAPARFELAHLVKQGTPNEKQGAIETLGEIGKPSLPLLAQLLQQEDRSVRLQCIWAYRKIGTSAFESLRPLLDHPDWRIRHDAIYAMAFCWNKAQEPKLLSKLTDDPELMVRVDSVRLLGMWLIYGAVSSGGEDTPATLEALREDTNPFMRYVVARMEEDLRRAQQNRHHIPPPRSSQEVQRRQNADNQVEQLGKEARQHLLQELETARGMRQLILVEWVGYMGKHAGEATDALRRLPRKEGSDLDAQIQHTLNQIEESSKLSAQQRDADGLRRKIEVSNRKSLARSR